MNDTLLKLLSELNEGKPIGTEGRIKLLSTKVFAHINFIFH